MQASTQISDTSLRKRILDAAERVVQSKGAAHLTIDAVVIEANVSKGGLLYHFRSKESLVTALLERTLERYKKRVSHFQEQHPGNNHRGVGELFAVTEDDLGDRSISLSLLAVATQNPELVEPAKKMIAASLKEVEKLERKLPLARLLFLSMVGMHFLDILNLLPLSQQDKILLREKARSAIMD